MHGAECAWSGPQADDRKFKDELGRVVEMDIWDSAKAAAAERLKSARQQLTRLESELTVREELLAKLQGQASGCRHPALFFLRRAQTGTKDCLPLSEQYEWT